MRAGLVSCVIPVRDGARYIGAAIDSVLAQTHPSVEIIVVNNGSTDETPEVVRRFGDEVRMVTHERPRAIPIARMRGVHESEGEFVAFLDSDDLWCEERIERQLSHVRTGDLEVSFCDIENFWEDGLEGEAEQWRAAGRTRGSYLVTTALTRRAVFDDVPLPSELRHMDSASWILQLRESRIRMGRLPEVLVLRRRHANNLTRRRPDIAYDEVFDLLKRRLDRQRQAG